MNYTFESWEASSIERVHTQFLKQSLWCAFQASNNVVRADIGCRPLMINLLQKYTSYTNSLQTRTSALCHDALIFENENSASPNFLTFGDNFYINLLDLVRKSKRERKKICREIYDGHWKSIITQSTKSASYIKFKSNITLEPHIYLKFN